jgi:hypothetical protein
LSVRSAVLAKRLMVKREIRKNIHEAIVKALRRTGEDIFSLSQQTDMCYVPRAPRGGTLAASGYTKNLPNGIEIGYTAPYASDVEYGHAFRPFLGKQEITVRAHKRKVWRSGRSSYKDGQAEQTVRTHTRVYKNKRLIGFQPRLWPKKERGPMLFRVLEGEPARKGQFFLTRAFKEKIGTIPDNIAFYLGRMPNVKKVTKRG